MDFYGELGRGLVRFAIVVIILVGLICLGVGVMIGWLLA